MSRASVWLCGLLAAACSRAPEPTPQTQPAAPAPTATDDPGPPAILPEAIAITETPARRFPAVALDRLNAPLYLHAVIPHPGALIDEVREHLLPPRFDAMGDHQALLRLLTLATGLPPSLAERTDLSRPFGCVIGELSPTPQVACVFGHTGGADGFARDIGATASEGHAGELVVGGLVVVIDSLGKDVALSLGDGFFAAAEKYLAQQIVARAPRIDVDLEIVTFADHLYQNHSVDLLALAEEPDERLSAALASATGDLMRRLIGLRIDLDRESDRAAMRKLGEYDTATVYVDLDHGDLAVGVHVLPRPGGRFPKDSLLHGHAPDLGIAADLPAEVLAFVAFDMDPWAVAGFNRYTTGPLTDADAKAGIAAMASLWALASGGPARAAEAAITAHFREDQALYAGPSAWALIDVEGATPALVGTRRLVAGKSGRDAWKTWAAALQDGVLRGELGRALAWSFTPAAWAVDGAEVDRWTIRVQSDALLDLDPKLAAIAREGIHVDRLEHAGDTHYVVAPGGEEAAVRRLLAAKAGERKLGDSPRFPVVRARDHDAYMLFAFDVARVRSTLAGWPALVRLIGADAFITTDLGAGLDDLTLRAAESSDGSVRGELAFGRGILRFLRTL